MSKANELKNVLVGLFRSGADAEHDADEMEELLEGIDFPVLAQALYSLQEPVYAFFTETNTQKGFDYYGAPLFPQGILLVQDLVEDRGDEFDMFSWKRYLELWLLPDMRFAVVSCLQTGFFGYSRISEYRAVKEEDWKSAGMEIDFLDFADVLEEKCDQYRQRELPVYEL